MNPISYSLLLNNSIPQFETNESPHNSAIEKNSVSLISHECLSNTVQFSHSVLSNSLRPHESQGSLSITSAQSLLKLTSIKLVMPSSHLILCHPLLLLPPIPPSIRIFSSESTLHMRWPKYWSFTFSISSSNEHPRPLGRTGWISLLSKGLSRIFSNNTVQKHQFFSPQLSL